MNVYLVSRIPTVGFNPLLSIGHDEQAAVVVVARSPREARKVASIMAGDEGWSLWLHTDNVRCLQIGKASGGFKQPVVVCRDYRAG